MTRHVHLFDEDLDPESIRARLGGKGAGLNLMTHLGIPVPPGFTIATDVCLHVREHGDMLEGVAAEVTAALGQVEATLGRRFGDATNPLLVSVRSGAQSSMPGMMDTILNVGLNDETVEGLAERSQDRRFAFDAYRRLLQMYGDVVLGVSHRLFEEAFRAVKRGCGGAHIADSDVSAEALEKLTGQYKALILEHAGRAFPEDVKEQLWGAIDAVFGSWENERAVRYRRMQGIPDSWGTACTVQAMVFGNMGEDCGSGVAFTRNPSTGERVLYGEYLDNAQGEDVVAGIRTPLALTAVSARPGSEGQTLERRAPEVFAAVQGHLSTLEGHYRDMQDVEFTIEKGAPWILQTRTGKRTAHAAVKIAVDLVAEGVLSAQEAVLRVDPNCLDQLLHARLPTPEDLVERGVKALASGLPASPGAATGRVVFDAGEAERQAADGQAVILVRRETSPEDIHGMKAAQGIVTATGGMTSHAAVVARGLGKCCVAGCGSLNVDYQTQTITVRTDGGERVLNAGDVITLDGSHGKIYEGALEVVAAATIPEFDTLMGWADESRRMRVRANADTPEAAKTARSYGAQGIGLCRTEHMFFAEDRLEAVRSMVLSGTAEVRRGWLDRLEPIQRQDFEAIFTAMDGLPVTIRLLDWPLHEFLPREEREFAQVAAALEVPETTVRRRAEELHEINPMLGHRGVRVGLTYPEIYEMQVRAVLQAAHSCAAAGVQVLPEIMIPVVCAPEEVAAVRKGIDAEIARVAGESGIEVPVKVGTMIELPRACVLAGEIAQHAEFFSFGTNDLTQTTFGISRDDSGRFLPAYQAHEAGLLEADPFARLDVAGVGELIRMACVRGKASRPDISLGLCGEHGGDPSSIAFCEEVGLAYISCSPPRLPIARLAAAQAHLRAAQGD